ncbi:MAG: YdbL family protein [Desulfobacteraceae bacterium]|nr:YdbL family protein [Desulfobacteraceae bacterium]
MKIKEIPTLPLLILLSLLLSAGSAVAGVEAIQQRMMQRLPVIDQLKAQGIVGENNQGYLEFVGNQRVQPEVVEAENQDRRQVYSAIAKKQGTTSEVVGRHRAAQIANRSKSGVYLQDANGKWYRK